MNDSPAILDVRYVKTPDGAHFACQVFGSGSFDVVFVPGFIWNVERPWWLEPVARGLRRIGKFARVVVFDRRGTGLSDRIDEANPPTLEARMDDLRAVMDEVGIERAALIGDEDGATLCAMLAASYPARVLAAVFPGSAARGARAPDHDSAWTADEWDEHLLLDAIERFLVSVQDEEVDVDRILATILFTDLVGSTEIVARIGDRAWRELVAAHDQRVRALLGRYRGREVDRAGDGFFAIFDGPARAVRCPLAIEDAVQTLGAGVRAGVHAGEVELDGAGVRGIAVSIGARVAAAAGAREVLVSSIVKDLVAGSGLRFEPRGHHTFKGVADEWELFAAVPRTKEPLV